MKFNSFSFVVQNILFSDLVSNKHRIFTVFFLGTVDRMVLPWYHTNRKFKGCFFDFLGEI